MILTGTRGSKRLEERSLQAGDRPVNGTFTEHGTAGEGVFIGKAEGGAIRRRLHDTVAETGGWVKQMLQGHLNYYAVSGNHPSIWWFCNQVRWLWLKALRRRSQKADLTWERFIRLVDRFFPPIKTLHPLPCYRFNAKTRGRSPVR